MIIEKLKEEDIPQLLELYNTLIPFETSLKESLETYCDIVLNDNYSLLVAKENGCVAGSALGICCKCLAVSFLVIEDVIVKDEFRGKGIGRKLMESLDEFAKSRNCVYAILVSSAHRNEAHKFYRNAGFTDDVAGFTDDVAGFRKLYLPQKEGL